MDNFALTFQNQNSLNELKDKLIQEFNTKELSKAKTIIKQEIIYDL